MSIAEPETHNANMTGSSSTEAGDTIVRTPSNPTTPQLRFHLENFNSDSQSDSEGLTGEDQDRSSETEYAPTNSFIKHYDILTFLAPLVLQMPESREDSVYLADLTV